MNDYIINPWFFYFLDIFESFKIIFSLISVLLLLASFFGIIYGMCEDEIEIKKKSNIGFIVGFILLLFATLIPTKNTLIQMAIADKVTYSNIEKVKKSANEFINYVIEKSEKLSKGDK